MRDFQAELAKLFTQHQEKSINEPIKEETKAVQLYNIHKRSLPVGMDKVVRIGMTLEDADRAIRTSLKAKVVKTGAEEYTLFYYTPLSQNATDEEKNIYYNGLKNLTKIEMNYDSMEGLVKTLENQQFPEKYID